jgi:uncharacterized protein YkwD
MRNSAITTAVALIVLAGCGGPATSSGTAVSHTPVSTTTGHSFVATTTRANIRARVAQKKAAQKKAAHKKAVAKAGKLWVEAVARTAAAHTAPPIPRAYVAPAPVAVPAPIAAPPAVTTSTGAEGELVADINSFRAAHGLQALTMHPDLVRKAESWARNMANGGCGLGGNGLPNICHSVLTDGITVQWTGLEENVGMISPSTNVAGMHNAYVNSPPHAANMLNGKMTYVGVGIAVVGNYMYTAEVFMSV